MRVLPPEESCHVKGIAMDVRPSEGACWLEDNGGRYHLYRIYDNEWWHFEYRPTMAGLRGGCRTRARRPVGSPRRDAGRPNGLARWVGRNRPITLAAR
jgi:hypothetical protein